MGIHDDGDIIKAVGFVTIYGAYLEDELAKLAVHVKQFSNIDKIIEPFRLAKQAQDLQTHLKELFGTTSDYHTIQKVLKNVEEIAKKRNSCIHSVLISVDGVTLQKNQRTSTECAIKSSDIYQLANEIFDLRADVMALGFSIDKLKPSIVADATT